MSIISYSSSSSSVASGESLLRAVQSSPTDMIKSALVAIKASKNDHFLENTSLVRRCHTIDENPLISQFLRRFITPDESLILLAQQNHYESTQEYIRNELFQSFLDQTKIENRPGNLWITPFIPSVLRSQLTLTPSIVPSLFAMVNNRLKEVSSEEKALELGWYRPVDESSWAEKLAKLTTSFQNFQDEITRNAERTLFSSNPEIRQKQYLDFCSNFFRDLPVLISKNMDYDFYETTIPYLLTSCLTAWTESTIQIHSMASSLLEESEIDFFSQGHFIAKNLLQDLLIGQVLPKSLQALYPGAPEKTIQELASNVHYQRAVKQWGSKLLQIEFTPESRSEVESIFSILSPYFNELAPNIIREGYTPSILMNSFMQFYETLSPNQKDFLWAPILDRYREALMSGHLLHITDTTPLRKLYQALDQIQKIETYDEYVVGLKNLHAQFIEQGIEPPFSSSTPKELAEIKLKSSSINSSMARLLTAHTTSLSSEDFISSKKRPRDSSSKEELPPPQKKQFQEFPNWRDALEAKTQAMQVAENEEILDLIIQFEEAENEEVKANYLTQQKIRIKSVLDSLEEKLSLEDTKQLKNFLEDRAGHLRPFGAALLGCSARLLSPKEDTDSPSLFLSWASSIRLPSKIEKNLKDILLRKPQLYVNLPQYAKDTLELRDISKEHPGLKYGITPAHYIEFLTALKDSPEGGPILKALSEDKAFMLAAAAQNGRALEFASKNLRNDRELVLTALAQNGAALQFANESLRKDSEIVLAAITQNGKALKFADKTFQNNEALVSIAIDQNGNALCFASPDLKKKRELVLLAVGKNGEALLYANEIFQNDKEIVSIAVAQNGKALEFAGKILRNDKETVLLAVIQNGKALQFASSSLKQNKEVVLAAVTQNGEALEFASKSLKKDKPLVLIAVNQNKDALEFASDALQEDPDLMLIANTI